MSSDDPTYEEIWREFHNFTFQALPNLERLKVPLKKAADVEQFLKNSASVVVDQQAQIDRMNALLEQRRTATDQANTEAEHQRQEQQALTVQHRNELSSLVQQISATADRLAIARASATEELGVLSKQKQELSNINASLALQIDSQRRELDDLRKRITAASAALK